MSQIKEQMDKNIEQINAWLLEMDAPFKIGNEVVIPEVLPLEKPTVHLVLAHSSENSLDIHFIDIGDERTSDHFTGVYGDLDELEEDHKKDIEELIDKLKINYNHSVDNLTIEVVPYRWKIPYIRPKDF